MLITSLRHFERKVIFSETTAFRKWRNTPFTSHSELKSWNRLLLFQRNACEFLVNACEQLKALSKECDFLWNYSIEKVKQHSIHFTQWIEVLLHFLNAVLSEKITFLWKCLKLLTSIQQKFTCISLKEKQSVPTLQFTVRSKWSVPSLSKFCTFRENHFPLKVP